MIATSTVSSDQQYKDPRGITIRAAEIMAQYGSSTINFHLAGYAPGWPSLGQ